MPIALASVGPLPGVALLFVFGVVNMLTMASIAEAVARHGTVRYGNAFFGRIVADYLGSAGSLILTFSLVIVCFTLLLGYYIGLATTLADATRVPAVAWTALLFLIGLYYLRRESLTCTVASALLVGSINVSIILILSLLAFTQVRLENLLYVDLPFFGNRSFDPSILEMGFGVILMAYFGHLSVGNCAKVVLRRDPSARSLIWGCVGAQAAAMLFYCIWILAINGSIAPTGVGPPEGHSPRSTGDTGRPHRPSLGVDLRCPRHGHGLDPFQSGPLQPRP